MSQVEDTSKKTSTTAKSGETQAARAGKNRYQSPSQPLAHPLYQSTVYTFDDLESMIQVVGEGEEGWYYYRMGSPNQIAFEQEMARLEGAQAALACGSGMGAITATLCGVLESGDHIIADKQIYGGTYTLLGEQLARFGIETTFVDVRNPAEIREAYRPGSSRILFFETITNPLMLVSDIPALTALAKELKMLSFVDATFSTPCVCRPMEYGADIVLHAATKYIGGHSDALGGVAAGKRSLIDQARHAATTLGLSVAPFDAWLNVRSLKTLPLRMAAHSRNALIVAEFLEKHPQVSQVYYPKLESHPQYEVAKRLMPNGAGGMVAFELKGGLPQAIAFGKAIKGIRFAPSLADCSTTISHPASTSHKAFAPEERLSMGISDGMLRLSVGIEDPQDLINELEAALLAS
jgi:cystathionine gamma-synthase